MGDEKGVGRPDDDRLPLALPQELTLEDKHRIEEVWLEEGLGAVTDADLVALLRDRYRPEPAPGPCPVCGDERTVAATGPGPTRWACSPLEDDPERSGMLRDKPGRGRNAKDRQADDEHYERSVTHQYRHGDSLVIEMLDRVARTRGGSA